MRKLLKVICVLAMLISCLAMSIEGKEIGSDFLYALGIIDEDYDLEGTVTKAELAQIFSEFYRYDTGDYAGKSFYDDVSQEHKNSNAINKLTAYGIYEKTQFFNPGDKATLDEAVCSIVKILGYDVMASKSSYKSVANKLNLYTNTSQKQSLNKNIVALIENALEQKVVETIWKENHNEYYISRDTLFRQVTLGIEKIKGRIRAVEKHALVDEWTLSRGYIDIDGTVLKFNEQYRNTLTSLLGNNVELYYNTDENGYLSVVYAEKIYATEMEIKLSDYRGISYNQIRYNDSNGKNKKLKLSNYVHIVYNNRPVTRIPTKLCNNGTMKFISSNNSSLYDTIIIKEYTDYIAEGYYAGNIGPRIELKNNADDLRIEDYDFITVSGEVEDEIICKVADIKNGDILSVIENDEEIEIIVSRKKLQGDVTSVWNEDGCTYVTVNKKDLMSSGFLNGVAETDYDVRLLKNTETIFYLNFLGNISGYAIITDKIKYGYLIWVDYDSSLSRSVYAKILQEDGSFFVGKIKLKKGQLKVDDMLINSSDYISQNTVNGEFIRSLISYRLNSSGEVVCINYPADVKSNGLYFMSAVESNTRYRNGMGVCNFGTSSIINKDALVFVVPDDIDSNEDNLYRVASANMFKNEEAYSGVSLYGTCERDISAPIVVYKAAKLTTYTEDLLIVSDIIHKINPDGEIVDVIYGYGKKGGFFIDGAPDVNLVDAEYTGNMIQLESPVKIETGDIVRGKYSILDSNFYYAELLYDASEKKWLYDISGKALTRNDDITRCGQVKAIYGDYMEFVQDDGSHHYYYIGQTPIYTIEDGAVIPTTTADIQAISEGGSTKIVLNEFEYRCVLMMIYN